MTMIKATSTIACLALTLGCATTQKNTTQPAETPEIAQPAAPLKFDQITLRRNGWDGEFRSDGSARLQYVWRNASVTPSENSAYVPEGTFALDKISKLLLPHLKHERTARSTTVYLRAERQSGAMALYLDDEEINTMLWSELRSKAVPNDEPHFEQLVNTYPLVPISSEGVNSQKDTEGTEGTEEAQRDSINTNPL